jgi:hypothetical protein
MKQHITPEDINELSENQLHNLKALWTPQEGDTFIVKGSGVSFLNNFISTFSRDSLKNFKNGVPENYLPLLSIGQMVDILKNDKWMLKINESDEGYWHVELDCINSKGFYREELCDALWNAVKSAFLEQ